jgi:hypothetical protein
MYVTDNCDNNINWTYHYLNFTTLKVPLAPTGATTICYGGSATLTRGNDPPAGVTYYWQTSPTGTSTTSGSGSTLTASPASTTTYYVRPYSSSGCWGQASTGVTVKVIVIPAAPTVSNSGPICAGGTVNLTASGLAPAGQAINFSTGSFSYINVAHSSAYTLSTNSTIEAWIYPTSRGTGTAQPIIYNKENSYEAAIANTGELQWAYNNTTPGWAWVGTGYIIPLNAWTHVTFVYDYTNSQFRTYVNGGLVHTYTISGLVTDPGNPFRIGNRGTNDPFYGSIDNVRIWNTARTASEIYNSLYLEYPAGSTTGLVALYPLNGNANATVGTNGSLVNAGGASWITPTYYAYTWTGTNAPAASTNQTQTTGAMNTAGTYPYTVIASTGGCAGAISASTTATVKANSVVPAAASANPPSVCSGVATSITLTASGGTVGTGAVVQWYTGSCGGALVGTGNPLTILQTLTSSATYYARYSGDCNTTVCASISVTVNPLPTFSVTQHNVSCFGGSDGSITVNILTGTAPYEYSSNNGSTYTAPIISTTYTFTGLNVAGSPYLIRVRDGNTCVSQQTCP